MTKEYYFGNAKWVGASERSYDGFSTLYGKFNIKEGAKVTLNVLGLGFFKCYINGRCINPDTFLPLSSEYEAVAQPMGEVFAGNRIYVPSFDITPYITEGENLIAIHYGGGWYCARDRRFGLPKAIYSITADYGNERESFVSGEDSLIAKSFVSSYNFTEYEAHDYRIASDCFDKIPENAEAVALTEELNTEYLTTDCPIDTLAESITPVKLFEKEGKAIYDAGKNLSGYPTVKVKAGKTVTVRFSEALKDGELDPTHIQNQSFTVTAGKDDVVAHAEFTWFGFRYFEIEGDGEAISVSFVHADVKPTSTFDSSNETLNWIYKTFTHTMLSNMHTGHPSDCPHLERRGYTGDGQLTTHAVFSILGAERFYKKWLEDIADSQDTLSGHIQYTAPYILSGGGPGGWGYAIVEVPYQMYRHYGDASVLSKYYRNMRRYIDFLEEHSEFGLVTSDMKGVWCLGDWCGPIILYPGKDVTPKNQQVILPAPMVNTYFMVKALEKMKKIAAIIGKSEDIPEYDEKIAMRKRAINAAYLNTFDGNFIMNIQGANAYAVDIGLGSEKTYPNMVYYYKRLGHYDTGIFATDILTRVLFERGDSDLAFDLITHDGNQGFEHWRRNGATTFHEYWDSNRSRSHSHPMFGAPVAYLFEYILGIRQTEESAGYKSLIIEPMATDRLDRLSGSMGTPYGTVAVEYKKAGDKTNFVINIPIGSDGVFRYGGKEYALSTGENRFTL